MPTPTPPYDSTSDDILGPIVTQLGAIINAQITPPPTTVYAFPPDGTPDDNSVIITVNQGVVGNQREDSNGFINLNISPVAVIHYFQIDTIAATMQRTYNWFHAYCLLWGSWSNQLLVDTEGVQHTRCIDFKKWRIVRTSYGGVPFMALIMLLDVSLQFPVALYPY